VQNEIGRAAPIYKEVFPGKKSKQWVPDKIAHQPGFAVTSETVAVDHKESHPFKLVSNNHMFHIGSYTHYAKALVEIGPDCLAEIHSQDAQAMGVQTGDRIRVESETHSVELAVVVNNRSTQGLVYIPKNWGDIPINLMRNGEKGLVSVKISKVG